MKTKTNKNTTKNTTKSSKTRRSTHKLGKTILHNKKYKSLTISGALEFNNLKVANKLTVNGGITGSNLQCKDLVVHGHIAGKDLTISGNATLHGNSELSSSKVHGSMVVMGKLDASKCHFQDIKIHTNKSKLADTTARNITVEKNQNKLDDIQELELIGKTIIKGDITFKSGNGKLVKEKDVVIEGKVEGLKA